MNLKVTLISILSLLATNCFADEFGVYRLVKDYSVKSQEEVKEVKEVKEVVPAVVEKVEKPKKRRAVKVVEHDVVKPVDTVAAEKTVKVEPKTIKAVEPKKEEPSVVKVEQEKPKAEPKKPAVKVEKTDVNVKPAEVLGKVEQKKPEAVQPTSVTNNTEVVKPADQTLTIEEAMARSKALARQHFDQK